MAQSTQGTTNGGDDARYETLLDNMSEGFVLCRVIRDEAGRVVDYRLEYLNPAFRKRAPGGQAVAGKRQLEVRPSTGPGWFEACDRALKGDPVRFEFEDPQTSRWYEVHMIRMSGEELGQLFVDVTARKAAEHRQSELFLELNHRVKNNLAIVSAVLELQARSSAPEVREQLTRAVDRIQSIAQLHSALYQQNSLDRVDLCPYLNELGDRLTAALLAGRSTQLEIRCDHVFVSCAEAVNIGLIVNELVTNAAKHAFPDRDDGLIEVVLSRPEPNSVRLVVRDDGIGGRAASRPGSLGLRLVSSLSRALGGDMSRGAGQGSEFTFGFPLGEATDAGALQQRLI